MKRRGVDKIQDALTEAIARWSLDLQPKTIDTASLPHPGSAKLVSIMEMLASILFVEEDQRVGAWPVSPNRLATKSKKAAIDRPLSCDIVSTEAIVSFVREDAPTYAPAVQLATLIVFSGG